MKKFRLIVRNYSSVFGWAILCIASTSAIIFVGIPTITRTVSSYNQMKTLKEEVSMLRQKAAILRSLDDSVLSNSLENLFSAVPIDKSLPTIFTTVESLASQSNVGLTELSLSQAGAIASQSAQSATKSKDSKNVLSFSAHITGSIDQVKTFLTTAPAIRRLIRVKELSVSFEDDTNAAAALTMESFYLPLGIPLALDSQALELLSEPEERLMSRVAAFPLIFTAFSASTSSGVLGFST